MSDPVFGSHHFLSWARQGIATVVTTPDTGVDSTSNNAPLPDRASVKVQLSVSADHAPISPQPKPVQVQLFGPGDCSGIDQRYIHRTEPRDGCMTFEPNYLCFVEFTLPDLPWLLTPACAKQVYVSPDMVWRLRP